MLTLRKVAGRPRSYFEVGALYFPKVIINVAFRGTSCGSLIIP